MKRVSILGGCLLLASLAQASPKLNWSQTYDAAGLGDAGEFVLFDAAGDPIVAGLSHDGVAGTDLFVRKVDAVDGAEIWSRRIPASDDSDMVLSGVAQDAAGDLILGGFVSGCVG